jgi:sugar O-acyltransferase (sialic acid O-acetyltransferase NeuD family)
MTTLILVAASGLAREVLAVERELGRFPKVCVVDDNPGLWGTTIAGLPIIGGLDCVRSYDDAQLLVCAGRGTARRSIVARLAELGAIFDQFTTVIHPAVAIPKGCTIGFGSVLLAGTVLTADIRIGAHVVSMPNVTLTHDDVVEDYVTLCAGVSLGGNVTVRAAAFLGMNSSIREGLTVGEEAVLGMASALLEPLPDKQTWAGVPARPLNAIGRSS